LKEKCSLACHSSVYKRTFSGLVAVLLALQWSDYLPSGAPFILLVGCATLNAIFI